jgi:hypothetical protein
LDSNDPDSQAVRSDEQGMHGRDRSAGIGLGRPAFRRGRAIRRLSHPRNRAATRKRPGPRDGAGTRDNGGTRQDAGTSTSTATTPQIEPGKVLEGQDLTWGVDSFRGILYGIGFGLLLWALIAGVVVVLIR